MKKETIPVAIQSVGAIIRVGDGRFLFQLRDDRPDVVMPGRWGLFGGEVEEGEDYHAAIIRELEEELGLTVRAAEFVIEFALPRPKGWAHRLVFEVRITEAEVETLTLREGAGMKVMTAAEFLAADKIVYWDVLPIARVLQAEAT